MPINQNVSTLTPAERREEATRILKIIAESPECEWTENQAKFLDQMESDLTAPISESQLNWLRRLKEKAIA